MNSAKYIEIFKNGQKEGIRTMADIQTTASMLTGAASSGKVSFQMYIQII